jgi:hypothetical protein
MFLIFIETFVVLRFNGRNLLSNIESAWLERGGFSWVLTMVIEHWYIVGMKAVFVFYLFYLLRMANFIMNALIEEMIKSVGNHKIVNFVDIQLSLIIKYTKF